MHKMGKFQWDDLQSERKYRKWTAYGTSKLATLTFAFELQRRATAAGSKLRSATALAASVPVTPSAPMLRAWPSANELLPAWVSRPACRAPRRTRAGAPPPGREDAATGDHDRLLRRFQQRGGLGSSWSSGRWRRGRQIFSSKKLSG